MVMTATPVVTAAVATNVAIVVHEQMDCWPLDNCLAVLLASFELREAVTVESCCYYYYYC